MIVTIIGSINSSKEEIKKAIEFCNVTFKETNRGILVYDPIHTNKKFEGEPLLHIMYCYLGYIEEADLILVVPKSPGVYGESTTYELAYAMKLGKPILEFVSGGGIGCLRFEDDKSCENPSL